MLCFTAAKNEANTLRVSRFSAITSKKPCAGLTFSSKRIHFFSRLTTARSQKLAREMHNDKYTYIHTHIYHEQYWHRARAPAQHCAHGSQVVRTPAHVHSLSTDRSALLQSCQPNGKNTCSHEFAQHCRHASQIVRTPAQHCTHASQMLRTPARAHSLSSARMPAKWWEHPLTRIRSALHTRQPKAKNTRARAPTQHCTHASQMVRTPAHLHPLSAAHHTNGKNTRSRAPAQHCTHATRSALHTCMPNNKNTRSRAPAQHCAHASQMVR